MIVFVEGKRYTIKEPSPKTLQKYGVSLNEWKEILAQQDYRCPICKRLLIKTTNIDHFHERNWSSMKDEKRKLYVRGVACWYCNRHLLSKNLNLEKAKNLVSYFEAFERCKPK
jgi:DNA-directed RNA polymerase subunit RPC12/RpoP